MILKKSPKKKRETVMTLTPKKSLRARKITKARFKVVTNVCHHENSMRPKRTTTVTLR